MEDVSSKPNRKRPDSEKPQEAADYHNAEQFGSGILQGGGDNNKNRERERRRHYGGHDKHQPAALLHLPLNVGQAAGRYSSFQALLSALSAQPVGNEATQGRTGCDEADVLQHSLVVMNGKKHDKQIVAERKKQERRIQRAEKKQARWSQADKEMSQAQ